MAYSVTNYDPLKVSVVVDGMVVTGFSDSSVVSIAANEDIVSPAVGVQGDVVYSENANGAGTITMSLQRTSASLVRLRQLALARKELDVVVSDANMDGGETISATRCRITKVPDSSKEKSAGAAEVAIFAPFIERK